MTSHDLAQRLVDARRLHRLIDAPPPDSLPPDAATAYAIQQSVLAGLGEATGAWKIGAKTPGGATSGAPIPASLVFESPARIGHDGFFRVLLELEIAFRFNEVIEPRREAYARDEVLSMVGVVLPAIEIVDSRFGEWPDIAPLAQLADAQNNGALITGHPVAYPGFARAFDFVSPELQLSFDGASLVPEATGNPAGDPRELLVWFVNHCAAMGIAIEPDWTITTGSYVGAHRVTGAGIVRGRIDGLGDIEVALTWLHFIFSASPALAASCFPRLPCHHLEPVWTRRSCPRDSIPASRLFSYPYTPIDCLASVADIAVMSRTHCNAICRWRMSRTNHASGVDF
jgi:2-keto-4-pentenoate hydratase